MSRGAKWYGHLSQNRNVLGIFEVKTKASQAGAWETPIGLRDPGNAPRLKSKLQEWFAQFQIY